MNEVIIEVSDRYPDDMQLHVLILAYENAVRELWVMQTSNGLLRGAIDEYTTCR